MYSSYGNVYDLIYQNYKQYFDFFNLQYYNNGSAIAFYRDFYSKSYNNLSQDLKLKPIQDHGIDASYLVMGKITTSCEGFVALPTLTQFVPASISNVKP